MGRSVGLFPLCHIDPCGAVVSLLNRDHFSLQSGYARGKEQNGWEGCSIFPDGSIQQNFSSMQLFDLSHTIGPGMPVYPGSPEPVFTSLFSLKEQGFSEQLLSLSSHTGTHVDLPSHMLCDARTLDDFGPEHFFGKGLVIDTGAPTGSRVTLSSLLPHEKMIRTCEFLLLCSGWSRYWGKPAYFEGYPVLDAEAAQWLCAFGLKGIGVDMISVDAADDTCYPVHKIFLEKGIIVIENLDNLSGLIMRNFIFSCFPLKVAGAEASPTRAVAITGEWRPA